MGEELKASMRTQEEGLAIIDLKGEVTSFADETINSLVNSAVREDVQKIVFNFTDVSYINSEWHCHSDRYCHQPCQQASDVSRLWAYSAISKRFSA